MHRRQALKVLGSTAAGVVVATTGGLVWLKRWSDPQTPLQYPFPPTPPSTAVAATARMRPTDPEIEGPFYTPNTPVRTRLAQPGTAGTPLTLTGRVLTTDGMPVPGAVLDVWNCDGHGVYDTDGFNLRGHQYADANGAFVVETVKPGDYRQFGIHRTPHVHFKVQGRATRLLTTQLYFPDEPLNAQDRFFDPDLVVAMRPAPAGGLAASFSLVLEPRG